MKIEIWIDFSCLKTYETYQNLTRAIKNIDMEYELLFRSFMQNDSTIHAHYLMHLTKRHDKIEDILMMIFKYHHEVKRNINDVDTLKEIVKYFDINPEDLTTALEHKIYQSQIDANIENAHFKGIEEVPHIRINGKINLSGYLEEERIKQELIKALSRNERFTHCEGDACLRKKG